MFNRKSQGTHERGKAWPIKKKKKTTETNSEKNQMKAQLDSFENN